MAGRWIKRAARRAWRCAMRVAAQERARIVRGYVAVRFPPDLHPKSKEEQVKHVVTMLNAVAASLIGLGLVSPALTGGGLTWRHMAAGFTGGGLILAARHYLRYIPDNRANKD